MEDPRTGKDNLWSDIKFGAYVGGASIILEIILRDGFLIPVPLAFSVSVLVTILCAYPLFVRGTKNRWRYDQRQWTFVQWAAFGAIVSVVAFFMVRMLAR